MWWFRPRESTEDSDPHGGSATSEHLRSTEPSRSEERGRMIDDTIRSRGVKDERVIAAMLQVARHEFVPAHLQARAYADQPLCIGEGQTVSQPYIVALMTELAEIGPGERCLEIGTGSGYQTAVLATLGASVVTLEISPSLAAVAQSRLRRLGYSESQIECYVADGHTGWPDGGPYDAILVTAAPPQLPGTLLAQLAIGGRLVAPVGPRNTVQRLEKWVRRKVGNDVASFESTFIIYVQFVPMTHS